jgi:uncharacterized membrane protein
VTALLVVTVAMLAFIVFMQAGRIHHLTRRIDTERARAVAAERVKADDLMWEQEITRRGDQ